MEADKIKEAVQLWHDAFRSFRQVKRAFRKLAEMLRGQEVATISFSGDSPVKDWVVPEDQVDEQLELSGMALYFFGSARLICLVDDPNDLRPSDLELKQPTETPDQTQQDTSNGHAREE
jgi:hypothetical protein